MDERRQEGHRCRCRQTAQQRSVFGSDHVYHPNVDGFDFLDIRCRTDPIDERPNDLSGVSGGGLWFIRIQQDVVPPHVPKHDFWLIGVAFLQIKNPVEPTLIKGHGPHSVYQKFLSDLRHNFFGV